MTSFVQDKQLTIALSGDIDHHSARRLMDTLRTKVDEYRPKLCVLDFRDVTFMDSSGIAVVISAHRCMRELDGRLKLKNIPPQAAKVFRAAGIERVAEVEGGVLV